MLIVGAICLAKTGSMSNGYVNANCTVSAAGGHLNPNYCDCKKCTCRQTCCDYDTTLNLATGTPVNETMPERSCKSQSPCGDWYAQLQTLSYVRSFVIFPCLYNAGKGDNVLFCLGFPCKVVTVNEYNDLVDVDSTYKTLLPLWIVLIVLGALLVMGCSTCYVMINFTKGFRKVCIGK